MSLRSQIELRPVGLDDLSAVRQTSALAYRAYAGPYLGEDQVDALVELVRSPEYCEQMLAAACLGAWIDERLIGTGGWSAAGTAGAGAKLIGVCVDPLFGRLGVGSQLVVAVEMQARRAGFALLSARVPAHAATFFKRLGYAGTSQGVWTTPSGVTIPVVHMRKGGPARMVLTDQGLPVTLPSLQTSRLARVH